MRHRLAASAAVMALVLAACSGGTGEGSSSTVDDRVDDGTGTTAPVAEVPIDPIQWGPCDDLPAESTIRCATLQVPYSYEEPTIGTFSLHVKMRPAGDASGRIGSMLVNPGGPGFGGSSLATNANYYFSSSLLEVFDIVAWDPRGTGLSTPAIDCIDDYDPYFGLDSPPETEEERIALIDATSDFNARCSERSGEILPWVSTRASAQDMDSLRRALGEDRITYFGFSYGSELGGTWATMFPGTVRAAVLDGASDPNEPPVQQALNQAAGFERTLDSFLAACSADATCEFHNGGDAEGAFDRLFVAIDERPLATSPGRTVVTQGVAYTAVAQAMYADYLWPELERALAAAQRGDGSGLLKLYDEYYQRKPDGTYGNELEAFLAISCLDNRDATTVEEVEAEVDRFVEVAPRFGANFAYGYACALWPVPAADAVAVTAKGAGPIVVVGTTGDAATPLESTKRLAASLDDGRLVVVEANQHTGYGVNQCVIDAVDRYLIALRLPEDGLVCSE
ncbi:MAG: alpha/beta hydrolase [Acidobacteria bacterium]|nr:alpha/beta hydrolase [Acidobacteriota bacterium]